MITTAAVLRQLASPFVLEEIELDELREDEVLVRLVGSGICHTDLLMSKIMPSLPAVLGHEGAGIVEQVGSQVSKVKPGDHVVLSYLSCGKCPNCLKALPSYCDTFMSLNVAVIRPDGSTTMRSGQEVVYGSFFGQSSFATHALASERNVIKVREDVPLELLGPLGCGIQTGAGAVMNVLTPSAGASLVVIGTGSVGLSAIMAAKVVGCTTIIGVDLRPQRLALAQRLGATHVINNANGDIVQQIRQITPRGAKYVLDTTSIPGMIRQAVECLETTGICGILGISMPGTEVSLNMNSILVGRTVRGIIEGNSIPDIFIPQLIELYLQGQFPFNQLIGFYPFMEINTAMEAAASGNVLKAVLTYA